MGGRTEADHRVPVPGLASLGILVLENHPLDTDSGLREHRQSSGLVPDNKIEYSKKNKVQENKTAVLKLFEGLLAVRRLSGGYMLQLNFSAKHKLNNSLQGLQETDIFQLNLRGKVFI